MYIAIERVTNKRYEATPGIKDLVLECPMCRRSVIAKTGEIKAHHFAHRHKNCGYYDYKGMSKDEWSNKFKNDAKNVASRSRILEDNPGLTAADLDSTVRYQISAKLTSWLPNRDKACPPQIVKNRPFHLISSSTLN